LEFDNSRRLLGLDVGDRRIGIAVSDFTGSLATPVEVYSRRGAETDVAHIADVLRLHDASRVIVGLPKNMNGSEGDQAQKTRDFAGRLVDAGLVVTLWDERLSTIEATRRLVEVGRKRRAIRQRVDAEAAAVILETYLDYLRSGGE